MGIIQVMLGAAAGPATPTYALSGSSYVNEGTTQTVTVTTTNVANGTVLTYSIGFGTTRDEDFTTALNGSVTINSNTGSITYSVTADGIAEGSDYFYVRLYDDLGNYATQMLVYITDTSVGSTTVVSTQHIATIDAVYNGATGTSSYTGSTGTSSQAAYRHGGFSATRYFEWTVNSPGIAGSTGFLGICDAAHWNAGPSFSGSTGERAAYYVGTDFAFGNGTGTTSKFQSLATFNTGDTIGVVFNASNGAVNFYKNGTFFCKLTNSGLAGQTVYPFVSYWYGSNSLSTTLRTTSAGYTYYLP